MTDIDARLSEVARTVDPIDRIRRLRDFERDVSAEIRSSIGDHVAAALDEARQTMTLQEVADRLGISRQRVHQLLQEINR